MAREYRGMSAAERQADRRERLLTAAYTLFAGAGYHATTIEQLCAAAHISNRAFYESFSSRADLMRAVFRRCVDDTLKAINQAIDKAPPTFQDRLVAAIEGYLRFVTEDARRARLMHLEARRAADILYEVRREAVQAFTQVIERAMADLSHPLPSDRHLLALGLCGAMTELVVEWVVSDPAPPVDKLIDVTVQMFRGSFLP
ncbi:TetR family transcriptional regulator [Thermobispora bispora]|uniref:Transcriptional regulator, TetR family n=1 Tax=Thermobispora bispora (strain ATCC 19993 / DSM 43833 / CBS 139.67 / JCM 10125 / KCTC 9307 / NBRC 14880 / R51) TaxID=469371 RepID=D6Y737_THEBD|nr:TetR/AcrR family transcriptional regulator [Thermobispora bispora]ADG87632.1 transcriptional regulator, TetR family [Thermobispora bispora DSM 43833]MDI9579870.1 TetR/AcrR family transcriptional regulator [Thermobispora sp.]